MEYVIKPPQKLSLSSAYSKLHTALWQKKQKNCFLQKQNTILNTKINSREQCRQKNANEFDQDCHRQKQKLGQIYEQIKRQEQWIKETSSLIEQKNFEKQYRRRLKIQRKLNKTNKKCKELNKKLNSLQRKVEKQDKQSQRNNKLLALNAQDQYYRQIEPDQVFAQLQKQNEQLNSILYHKKKELVNQSKRVKNLNGQLIELLSLKNWLRKFVSQSTKQSTNAQGSLIITSQKKSVQRLSHKNSLGKQQKGSATLKARAGTASLFRKQPKLKITNY